MPAPLPRRLCRLIVRKHAVDRLPFTKIARQLKVDRKTVADVVNRWRRGANLTKPGRKGILQQQTKFRRLGGYSHLRAILDRWECIYLDEIVEELERRIGTRFHRSTIWRAIRALGWSNKKLDTRAREASRRLRAAFRHRMHTMYKWHQFVWMDEVSKVPHLSRFPGRQSVVVLDNCKIHKSRRFLRLIKATGAIVEFLPAYSPQYNPIERVFGQAKAWLRRYGAWADTVPGYLAIDRALRNTTRDDCLAYIRKSGSMYMQS